MYEPMLTGFLLGLSLILAIGPQNAFVLRQGLLGRHVLADQKPQRQRHLPHKRANGQDCPRRKRSGRRQSETVVTCETRLMK